MNKGTKFHEQIEGPIFDEVGLYKVITTNKNQTVMIMLDGSVGMIIPFKSINCNSFSEEQFEELFDRIKRVIDGLDDSEVSVQFLMMREKALLKGGIKAKDLPSYLRPRAEYLQILSDNNGLFENSYYMAIHCKNKNEARKKDGVLKTFIDKIRNRDNMVHNLNQAMLNIKPRIIKLLDTQNSLCAMLRDLEIEYNLLKDAQSYYNILQKFTRPNKSKFSNVEITKESEALESPRQALFSGVRGDVRKDDFTLDDYYHRVYTLDRAPRKEIRGKSIQAIDSLPFEFIYSLTFRKMSHKETLDTFKWRLMQARMTAGKNQDALVEDRTLTVNEQRISHHYDTFAEGDSSGIELSANLVLRVHESLIDKMCREEKISRPEMLRRYDQMMHKKVFASFGGSEWVNEQNIGWKVFCNILPGMSTIYSLILKKIVVISQDLPYFMSIYNNQIRGAIHNGTNHFIDMKDNMIPFDIMNPTFPAWNYSISGQTGSGKSVLMNTLLTMQLAETATGKPPTICILDVGGDYGSYSKFMRLAKGTQINLSGAVKPRIQMFELQPARSMPSEKKKKELSKFFLEEFEKHATQKQKDEAGTIDARGMEIRILNFFNTKLAAGSTELTDQFYKDKFEEILGFSFKKEYLDILSLKEGECVPDQKRMNLIMALFEVILSSSGKNIDGFVMFDPDEISRLIYMTYETIGQRENRFPYLSDMYTLLENEDGWLDLDQPNSRKLLYKIRNWTTNGQYPMFDQPTSIDLTNNIILADMKGVEAEPKLQMVYTLLISQLFSDKMYFTKVGRKMIVRDEAWSLMKNDRAREFFVEDLRTARKNGFATVAISQLPTDYLQPDPQAGRAIMSSMQVNIFCKFDGQAVCRQVGDEYKLNEEMIEELTTLGIQSIQLPDGSIKKAYSKFMMLINKQVYLFKNILHPFEYALYSSSTEDNIVINYFLDVTKEFKQLEDVLHYMAKGQHIGNMDLAKYLRDVGQMNMARMIANGKEIK